MDGFLAFVVAGAAPFAPSVPGVASDFEPDPKDADRSSDVLDDLVTEILESDLVQSVTDLITDRARDTDAARFGERFEARRHVDAIAKNVVFLNDHVAQIDADAELYPSRRRDVRVASRHPTLDLGSAQHRVGYAVELDQQAVAGGLYDAAAVPLDDRIDKLNTMRLETCERPRLVGLHHPTVTDHVSGDDRCEPTLWFGHVYLPGCVEQLIR